jgi:beta-lactam-binding protein with PASTA domain
VLDNGTVTVTMSLGPERYAVPKVARMTVDQAQDALLEQHLTYGRSLLQYSSLAKGKVLGSNPAAGRHEPPGFQVDLIVSRGPRPIHIRDWTGASADRAVRVLRAQHLEVDTSDQEFSDSVPEGRVIAQDPLGEVLHPGDGVFLTVSRGPQLVEVPGDLRAMGVEAATELLQGLGFHVEVVHSDLYLGLGFVASSSPGPGSTAPRGSTVIVRIV